MKINKYILGRRGRMHTQELEMHTQPHRSKIWCLSIYSLKVVRAFSYCLRYFNLSHGCASAKCFYLHRLRLATSSDLISFDLLVFSLKKGDHKFRWNSVCLILQHIKSRAAHLKDFVFLNAAMFWWQERVNTHLINVDLSVWQAQMTQTRTQNKRLGWGNLKARIIVGLIHFGISISSSSQCSFFLIFFFVYVLFVVLISNLYGYVAAYRLRTSIDTDAVKLNFELDTKASGGYRRLGPSQLALIAAIWANLPHMSFLERELGFVCNLFSYCVCCVYHRRICQVRMTLFSIWKKNFRSITIRSCCDDLALQLAKCEIRYMLISNFNVQFSFI